MKPSRTGLMFLLLVSLLRAEETKPVVKLSADEKALLELLNKERKKEKLPELTVNPLLTKAARQHSENMAKQEKMSHELDGKGVGARVTDAGYDYRSVGENLAKSEPEGEDSPPSQPADIHKMWMDSKGHRANILSPKYREIGLSVVKSKKGTYYYTQVFAVSRK